MWSWKRKIVSKNSSDININTSSDVLYKIGNDLGAIKENTNNINFKVDNLNRKINNHNNRLSKLEKEIENIKGEKYVK